MGWNAGRKSNGLDFSDDCTECAQIAAANAVAAASMHSRCKVPPNCVSIQYRKLQAFLDLRAVNVWAQKTGKAKTA